MRILTFAMAVLLIAPALLSNADGSSAELLLSEYVLSFTNTSPDDTFGVNLYLKTGPEETYYGSMWWTLVPGMSVEVSLDLSSVENLDDIREIGFGLEAGIGDQFGQADHMRVLVHDPRVSESLAGTLALSADEFLMSLGKTYVKPSEDWADLMEKTYVPGNSVEYDVAIYGTDFVEMGIGIRFDDGEPCTGNLIAGQYIVVGDVTVWYEDGCLYVRFTTTDDWYMDRTHLHVATSLEDIPQKNGNPRPGRFDYQTVHDPAVTEYTYEIPLDSLDWDEDTVLYIAAHADVHLINDDGDYIQRESAWRDGYDFPGNDWATYFIYNGDADSTPSVAPSAHVPRGRGHGRLKK